MNEELERQIRNSLDVSSGNGESAGGGTKQRPPSFPDDIGSRGHQRNHRRSAPVATKAPHPSSSHHPLLNPTTPTGGSLPVETKMKIPKDMSEPRMKDYQNKLHREQFGMTPPASSVPTSNGTERMPPPPKPPQPISMDLDLEEGEIDDDEDPPLPPEEPPRPPPPPPPTMTF